MMVPFGYPKYLVPYYNRDPKRDHDFDNHPYSRFVGYVTIGYIEPSSHYLGES